MEEKIKQNIPIDIEPNSKPMLIKRILSYLADVSITFVLFFCLNLLAINTPIANNLNRYKEEMILYSDKAKLETGYGDIKYIEENEVKSYQDQNYYVYKDDADKNYIVQNLDKNLLTPEIIEAYTNKMSEQKFRDLKFSYDLHSFTLVALSFLITETLLFLVVPLISKKRSTIGQMLCGIELFATKRMSCARWYHVLFRFMYILIVETLLPYLATGMIGILCYMVISFIITILNKKYRTIRDFISGTMLIESKSYSPIVKE